MKKQIENICSPFENVSMLSNGVLFFILCILLNSISTAIAEPANSQLGNQNNVTSESTDSNDLFFHCKNGKNSRWLRAYRLDNGKCHTLYSKDGYLQIVSSATYFSSCEAVLHNVRKNIEEGGYKCAKSENFIFVEIE